MLPPPMKASRGAGAVPEAPGAGAEEVWEFIIGSSVGGALSLEHEPDAQPSCKSCMGRGD
jgi:hypothetical protein